MIATKKSKRKKNITKRQEIKLNHSIKTSRGYFYLKKIGQKFPESEPSFILALGYKVKSKYNWYSIGGWQRSNSPNLLGSSFESTDKHNPYDKQKEE